MNKNNSSNNQQNTGKDANDSANQKKNQYVQNQENENPTGKYNNPGNAGLGKGTGLSNEANSAQSEESWQGTGGSMANEAQRKNMNQNDGDQVSKNYSSTQNSSTANNIKEEKTGKNDDLNNNNSGNREKANAVYSNDKK